MRCVKLCFSSIRLPYDLNNSALLRYLLLLFILLGHSWTSAQPRNYTTSDLLMQLNKLRVLGAVLYIAAHPDDENTRLIAYFANEKKFQTAYLSATRGDGGQNLIGPEIREQLGIIRTQELLAARRIDGGRQFFSRANDFGYSKQPGETFNLWDREKVLEDFVWVIRNFRPDVIITRFDTIPGITHGHHTASAILANEAFQLSGDPNAFPDQLNKVDTFKPKAIYFNTSSWFYRQSGKTFSPEGKSKVDVGAYNPILGYSYSEIAARSRSMHKSQGFGSSGSRGEQIEYLEPRLSTAGDLFEGIDTSWSRVKGGGAVDQILQEVITAFNPAAPWKSVGQLLVARKIMQSLPAGYWVRIKQRELDELLMGLTGTYLALRAESTYYSPGDQVPLDLEAVNRSEIPMVLEKLTLGDETHPLNQELVHNRSVNQAFTFRLPETEPVSQPYWLRAPGAAGMYRVDDPELKLLAENPPALSAMITLRVEDQLIDLEVPVVHSFTDPVKGEVIEPLVVQPRVMINVMEKQLLFSNSGSKSLNLRIIAGQDSIAGEVGLELPVGWQAIPEKRLFYLTDKGEELELTFEVQPPARGDQAELQAYAEIAGKRYQMGREIIDYDHIPLQTFFPEARTRLVKIDFERGSERIAYLMGAGDEIPSSLSQVGYDVALLEKDDVNVASLADFDAVILGVRAFNTLDWLAYKQQELFTYVHNGGTLLVQYNTSYRMVTQDIAPYPLQLSRDRVTDEQAEVRILAPEHPVMNVPNEITAKDFEGWVQERGLYFPDQWSDAFVPIFSANDEGETPKNGGLLVADYGKGRFIYTGYSWFRELPAGVPGAYRIFANLIAKKND